MGYRHLPRLRDALKRELKIDTTTSTKKAAAIRSRGEFQLGMGLTRFAIWSPLNTIDKFLNGNDENAIFMSFRGLT